MKRIAQGDWLAGAGMAVATFVTLMATAQNVSITWDEPIYNEATERAWHWMSMVLHGNIVGAFDPYNFGIGWGLVFEATPLNRLLNAVGFGLTHTFLPPPTVHRVGTIALAAAGLGLIVIMVSKLRRRREALFAAGILLLSPRLFFHAHLAATDYPLMVTWGLATLFFLQEMTFSAGEGSPRRSGWIAPVLRRSLVGGFWFGLALLAKVNAVLLGPVFLIWTLFYRRSWRHLAILVVTPIVAVVTVYLFWPWVWKDPLSVAGMIVDVYGHHPDVRQWFAGRLYSDTPWWLMVTVVLTTTPALFLLLGGLGIFTAGRTSLDGKRRLVSDYVGMQLIGAFIVLIYFAGQINDLHDQERMLLPAIFHLALLAGAGFSAAVGWLEKWWRRPLSASADALIATALGVLLMLPPVVSIVQLHPYELAYYNEFIGGPQGARRQGMETIYFASTYNAFLDKLNTLPAGSKVWVMPNSYDSLLYYQKSGLLRPDLKVLVPPGWGSFYADELKSIEYGELQDADYALIDARQTTFNDVIPEYRIQGEWARTKPELQRLERDGLWLASLYAKK